MIVGPEPGHARSRALPLARCGRATGQTTAFLQ